MMRSVLIILALVLSGAIYGQNVLPPHLYLMNQTMLNPAYAGMHDNANLTAISRGQWVGMDGAPFTHTLVGSSSLSHHSAAGFSLVKDSYGINSDTEIKIHYSYRIEMLNSVLSLGLQGGMINYKQDPSRLDVELSDDPLVHNAKASFSSPTFGFGMMYKSERLFLGLGVPRITGTQLKTEEIFTKTVTPVYNLSGGLFIHLLNGLMVKPSFLLSYQDEELLTDINAQLQVGNKVWLGVSLRNLKSPGINLIFTEDDVFHLGYSYQIPVNEFELSSFGTHELIMSIDMKFSKQQNLDRRYF
ncbi:MAG: hypothetical protein CMB80_33195 [Flammeovirgaceae bacterium]|nr:hypothetical protein [Flammeovirgaceae bacterium]HCX22889.1 hypothetical protein [Cytophagales bacterium]|tara:strand:- start:1354 stop:2256 length:903 start_codon:yes stop_codon:yes gene_type:complete